MKWLKSLDEAPNPNNDTKKTAQGSREGRSPQRTESHNLQGQSILGEGRQESPTRVDEHPRTVSTPSPSPNGPGTRNVSTPTPVLGETNEEKGKSRSATQSPKRARSKEGHPKKKTFSLSPKRSMSRLLQRFKSSPDHQHPPSSVAAPS